VCSRSRVNLQEYTRENDAVYKVYGGWSPCIFFDHYPATNVTMIGMMQVMAASASMTIFVVIHMVLTHPGFFTALKGILWCGPLVIMQFSFTNIFSVSAYVDGYTNAPDYSGMTAAEYANATAGMTRDEIDGVSPELFAGIALHTVFLILYLSADIGVSILQYQHNWEIKSTAFWPPNPKEGWRASATCRLFVELFIFIMYFFGMFTYVLSLCIFIASHDGENRFHWKEYPSTYMMELVADAFSTFHPSKWFFLVMGARMYMVPAELGISYSFTNPSESTEKRDIGSMQISKETQSWKTGNIGSELLVSWGYKAVAILMILTYCFQSTNLATDDQDFPLAKGFRLMPFTLFFAPIWTITTYITATGMALMCINERLNHGTSFKFYAMSASAILAAGSMLICTLTVIPTSPAVSWAAYMAIIGILCWVLSAHKLGRDDLSQTENARIILWVTLWILGLNLTSTSNLTLNLTITPIPLYCRDQPLCSTIQSG